VVVGLSIALVMFLHMLIHKLSGCFEGDEFYDYCDQEGILIWHDLMTACGVYPTQKFFADSVVTEVRYQVKRLRNHPCIAIWCGNNEDFMMADRRGDNYDLSDTTGPWENTPLPHRLLYMKLWPDIIAELDPETFYWPSSPWGLNGKEANDPTVGDLHQWNGKIHSTCNVATYIWNELKYFQSGTADKSIINSIPC
jgi:beta-mannosidase